MMDTKSCPKCGTKNPAGTMICEKCRIILKLALEHLAENDGNIQDKAMREQVGGNPPDTTFHQSDEIFERECANCGEMFRPKSPETQYLCNNCEQASNQWWNHMREQRWKYVQSERKRKQRRDKLKKQRWKKYLYLMLVVTILTLIIWLIPGGISIIDGGISYLVLWVVFGILIVGFIINDVIQLIERK
jgi:predicted RNA-binding Zn-ribbon protein involved in translation (DUF1610 family)